MMCHVFYSKYFFQKHTSHGSHVTIQNPCSCSECALLVVIIITTTCMNICYQTTSMKRQVEGYLKAYTQFFIVKQKLADFLLWLGLGHFLSLLFLSWLPVLLIAELQRMQPFHIVSSCPTKGAGLSPFSCARHANIYRSA